VTEDRKRLIRELTANHRLQPDGYRRLIRECLDEIELLEGPKDMEAQRMLFADGFDEAVIGVHYQAFEHESCVVYDYDRMVDVLKDRDGMSTEEAQEFIDVNVVGAYMGKNTPIFISVKSVKEIRDEGVL